MKAPILQAIDSIPYTRGLTNTADALQQMRTLMFTADKGDRADVPNYGVIVTDGEATVQPEMVVPEAMMTKLAGVHLLVVPIGKVMTSLGRVRERVEIGEWAEGKGRGLR